MPEILTRRRLNRATLARQMLLERERVAIPKAIDRLVGLQAQQARPPFVGLWSRVEGFERAALVKLIERRAVVRATLWRGTIHLTTAVDFVRLRPRIQAGLTAGMKSILGKRALVLDVPALVATARALFEEQPRTFDALRGAFLEQFPEGDERAMAYAVRLHLPLVLVPTETTWAYPGATDFAVAETWLGRALGTDDHPGELVTRYLAAFGPATPADAQTWSGHPGIRAAFEELKPELRAFRDERGRELFDLGKAPRPSEETPAPVRFVADFDNLILGHADRTRVIADEHRTHINTKNALVPGTVLVDGFVAGLWKVVRKKKTAALVVSSFGALPKGVKEELADEGSRLLAFLEEDATTCEITFEKI